MSRENVEIVRGGYVHFAATGEMPRDIIADDFVWDMSKAGGWPERQTYEGSEGVKEFLTDWAAAWDDWENDVEDLLDAGDRVVAVMRQRGRSKEGGVEVDMRYAQVWTVLAGIQTRMEMYLNVDEAFKAVGLPGAGEPDGL